MVLHFRTPKLEKVFASEKELGLNFTPTQAQVLILRISQLRSARRLADLASIPPLRAIELDNDRKGQLSLSLGKRDRLILVPAQVPTPTKPDGGLDWHNVTEVTILEVVPYNLNPDHRNEPVFQT